jgi:hypothetical protein
MWKLQESTEWGGTVYNYANGRWVQVVEWTDEETKKQATQVCLAAIQDEVDEIYIAISKAGHRRGLIEIFYYGTIWQRAFWDDIYLMAEAFDDASKEARRVATKMGYRDPDAR